MKLNQLDTEKVNQNSLHIDEMSTIDILKTINNEDQKVAFVVQDVILQIAQAVDCIYEKMCLGGRLIYVGAGTSGRLGILDASECPPTYGVEPTLIQGIIAGGVKAVTQAVEGAEDSKQLAQIDLEKIDLNDKDINCCFRKNTLCNCRIAICAQNWLFYNFIVLCSKWRDFKVR